LGSFDRNDQFFEVCAGQPLGYAELAASRTSAGDYEDGAGRAIASAYERWSVRAALGWTPDDRTLLDISTILSDGEAAYADRAMDGSQFTRRNVGFRFRREATAAAIESIETTA